jgi:hypothetical protein
MKARGGIRAAPLRSRFFIARRNKEIYALFEGIPNFA